MKSVLITILKQIGWMKLLAYVWDCVYPELSKIASKTETKLDDNVLKVLDNLISQLSTNGDIK